VSADVQTNVTAEVNTTLADSFLNLVVAGLQELEAIGLLQISERGQPLLRSPTDAAPQIEEGELFDPEPNDKLPGSTDLGATHIDAPKEVTPPAPGGNGQQPKQET